MITPLQAAINVYDRAPSDTAACDVLDLIARVQVMDMDGHASFVHTCMIDAEDCSPFGRKRSISPAD